MRDRYLKSTVFRKLCNRYLIKYESIKTFKGNVTLLNDDITYDLKSAI